MAETNVDCSLNEYILQRCFMLMSFIACLSGLPKMFVRFYQVNFLVNTRMNFLANGILRLVFDKITDKYHNLGKNVERSFG